MNTYVLGLIFLTIINLALCVYISPSILHPIRMYCLFWSAFVILPVIFWNVNYKWNYGGLYFICLSVLFSELGAIVGSRKAFILKKPNSFINNRELEKEYCWLIIYVIILFGAASAFLSLFGNGFQIKDILSVKGLIYVSSKSAELRYEPQRNPSSLHQIFSIFVYLAPLCGGYAFNYSISLKKKVLSLLTMVPIFLEMVFTSGKSGFIASLFFWIAGWCVSYVKTRGDLPYIRFKYLFRMMVGLLCIFLILFTAMLLRTGEFSTAMVKVIYEKFWIYAFGQMVEFDAWFPQGKMLGTGLGSNTYMTFFRLLGLADRKGGIYDVLIEEYGNVFTVFRGIIADFGIIGGLIYSFVRGLITELCFNSISSNTIETIVPTVLVACAYFANLYGFIVSPWVYTSYILTMVCFGGFILVFNRAIKYRRIEFKLER